MATLYVGIEKKEIKGHKVLLGYYSKFFEAAIYGPFSESPNAVVNMPENAFEDIRDFAGWLYTGKVSWKDCGRIKPGPYSERYNHNVHDDDKKPSGNELQPHLSKEALWIFGDK